MTSMFSPFEKILNDGISAFFQNLVDQGIQLFLGSLVDISGAAANILEMPVVNQTILYAQSLAITLVGVKVSYEAFMAYILRQGGDPDADPGGVLIRLCQAVAIIASVPWIVKYMYLIGTSMASDISALPGQKLSESKTIMEEVIKVLQQSFTQNIFIAIAIIFALVMLIIVLIQTFIRAGELAVIAAAGSFMSLGLTNPSSQFFSSWFRELTILSMSQAIQIYIVKVAFSALQGVMIGNPFTSLCMFIALLWVAYKSPSALRQFIHATGLGRVIGGAAQTAGSMAIMRMALGRG